MTELKKYWVIKLSSGPMRSFVSMASPLEK
jgi:hypothetical protein